MFDATHTTSTRPYLIRAIYEWCTDNALTPFIAVQVDESVRVPNEYVQNGEIVLNISFDATSALSIGNKFIEFKGRFGGVARDIFVPINRVIAIYARENGEGMHFEAVTAENDLSIEIAAQMDFDEPAVTEDKPDGPSAPRPPSGRPTLTRVK